MTAATPGTGTEVSPAADQVVAGSARSSFDPPPGWSVAAAERRDPLSFLSEAVPAPETRPSSGAGG